MLAVEFKNVKKYYYLFNSDIKKIPWLFTRKGHVSIKKAVDDVSFKINKGEVVGLIGRNGTGKSTMLKLIAGITLPNEGRIKVNGTVTSMINLSAGLERDFTGIENIYRKCYLIGMDQKEIEEKLNSIVEFADIGDFIYKPVKMYSSGMKARLSFSISTHSNSDILLVDEVFAVGDRAFRKKSAQKTKELLKNSKTVVIVSHNESVLEEFCTRCIYFNRGKLVYDGDVSTALEMYRNKTSV